MPTLIDDINTNVNTNSNTNESGFRKAFKIFLIILVLVALGYIGYKLYKNKESSGGGDSGGGSGGGGNICGDKPNIKCDDNQDLVCDKKLGKWRCKRKCETDKNPFPSLDSFNGKCDSIDKIKCDENGNYYCDNSYCLNNGKLVIGGICICTPPYILNKEKICGCDTTPCGKGIMGDDCKCQTCCDSTTSISGMCSKYNGPKGLCEMDCSTEKGLHYVYDPTQGRCICPSGFEIDKDGHCVPLSCNNGKLSDDKKYCICDAGYTGPDCNINICKNGGVYNTNTKICDCPDGFYGNYCQYDKSLCNYHGKPNLDSNGVYTGTCSCDNGWFGDNCTCQGTKTLGDKDKCEGKYYECTDKGWQEKTKSCSEIYNDYTNQTGWENNCKIILTQDQIDDNQIPVCSDNPTRFTATKTCSSPSLDKSICNDCKNTGQGGCLCVMTDGSPSYQCYSQQKGVCGPVPAGMCEDGSSPQCIPAGSGDSLTNVWACQGTSLPKDFAMKKYGVSQKDGGWYYAGNPYYTTVYPTFNMDKCDPSKPADQFAPFQTLDTIGFLNPGYTSFNSPYGFVYNDTSGVQQFIKADKDDPKYKDIIIYNYRDATLSDDGKKIIGGQKLSDDAGYDIMYPDGKGCAKWKKSYDPSLGNKNTTCVNNGTFNQICTDKDYNVVDCTKNPYYITDIGYCICTPPYKGRFCQYNPDEICNGGTFDTGYNCTYIYDKPGSYTLNISPQYKYISWDIIGGGGGGGNALAPANYTFVCDTSYQPMKCTGGGGIAGGGSGSSGERNQQSRIPLNLSGNTVLNIKVGKGGSSPIAGREPDGQVGEGSTISLGSLSQGVGGGNGGYVALPISYTTIIYMSNMKGGKAGVINSLKPVGNQQIPGQDGTVITATTPGITWTDTTNITPSKGGMYQDTQYGKGGDGGIKGVSGQSGNDGYVKIVLHLE